MTNQNRFLLPTGSANSSSSSCKSTSLADQENRLSVDTDFDSYWEEEARNPHRNRIRIGRQYQATVPPLLNNSNSPQNTSATTTSEVNLDQLETLTFCPNNSAKLSDNELEHYFTVARSLNLFASLVETRSLLGRDVTIADLNHIRHKEGLNIASVIQPCRTSWLPSSIAASNLTTSQASNSANISATNSSSSSHQQHPKPADPNVALMKALSHFISLHHPCHHDSQCKKSQSEQENSAASKKGWNLEEIQLFSKAIEVCGKNFGSIKKEFLPSKSVKSIVEYYYIGYRDALENRKKSSTSVEANDVCGASQKSSTNNDSQGGSGGGGSGGGLIGEGQGGTAGGASAAKPGKANNSNLNESSATSFDATTKSANNNTNNDPRLSVYNFDEDLNSIECSKPGSEVKPLKAKPIKPHTSVGPETPNSNVGSLNFFMDGQLVLKLNARQQQQEGGEKCHWVQSGDRVITSKAQKKYSKRFHDQPSAVSPFDPKLDDFADEDSKESMNSITNLSQNSTPRKSDRSPKPKRAKMKSEVKVQESVTHPGPVLNQSTIPWLQANSFAMAAALFGSIQYPQNAAKPMDLSVEHNEGCAKR